MKNIKRNVLIVLVCVGVICFIVCVTNMRNEKENTFNASKESEEVVCNESSGEEQSGPEEQEKYDSWEIEHVREIEFEPMEYVTQDDIVRIGRLIHLKHLTIKIDESEIDLSLLGSLVELETLDIVIQYGCSPDLSFMESLSQLESLDICVGSEVDLAPLGSLNGLRQLSISTWSADAQDLSFLEKLGCVEEVTIIKCEVSDLSIFQNMTSMRELDVSYVEDVDLCYLANLKNLESLAIIGADIRNPEGLSNLTRLRELSLCDNSLEARYDETERTPFDIQQIANLVDLEWLDLYFLYAEDVSSLANFKCLRHISLTETNVRDISPLAGLEKLDELYLFGNRSELVKEQAETLFHEIEYKIITEKWPSGF